ncbi:hypothetical protein [Catenulispora rubra]|uniref:hypothetical protein n=1 Tax=Catenulispora rubra TaxID=280293 RepID=UPI001892666B|nr:hypothetical protein [Catenulispora rubra]
MFLGNSSPVADYPRAPRWWAVPSAATVAFLAIGVTSLVTASIQNSHGAGPQQGMAAVAVYFLVLLGFFALCGGWAAAAFPTGQTSHRDRIPPAVLVFLFLTALFLCGAAWTAFSLATNSIGGK